jgi:hypothetical protein
MRNLMAEEVCAVSGGRTLLRPRQQYLEDAALGHPRASEPQGSSPQVPVAPACDTSAVTPRPRHRFVWRWFGLRRAMLDVT